MKPILIALILRLAACIAIAGIFCAIVYTIHFSPAT